MIIFLANIRCLSRLLRETVLREKVLCEKVLREKVLREKVLQKIGQVLQNALHVKIYNMDWTVGGLSGADLN